MASGLYSIVRKNGREGKAKTHFHKGQRRAYASKARFVFALAGTQGGKTEFAPWWMWREMNNRGDGEYAVVSPSFPLQNLKVVPAYEEVFSRVMKVGKYYKSSKVMQVKTNKLDAKIYFGSADKPESLESFTAKGAHLDEVGQKSFKLDSWEAILRRLSINQGRVLGTTTLYNLGWLKSEVYDRWQEGDPDFDVIQFPSYYNPAFPIKEYLRAARTLPRWKFDMFYRGVFSRPAGMIYDCFDTHHQVDPFHIPSDWPRYIGVDFGGVNTAIVWIAEEKIRNEPSNFYIYREYLEGGTTAKGHADKVRALSVGENLKRCVGGAWSEDQWRSEFRAGSLPVSRPPINDVEVGIDRVYGLLNEDRLFVFKDACKYTISQFNSYARELNALNEPTEKIEDKNTYHYLDAVRYICSWLNRPIKARTGGSTVARK